MRQRIPRNTRIVRNSVRAAALTALFAFAAGAAIYVGKMAQVNRLTPAAHPSTHAATRRIAPALTSLRRLASRSRTRQDSTNHTRLSETAYST